MLKTIRACYTRGQIELAEPLPLEEGAQLELTVRVLDLERKTTDPTEITAGAWSTLLDCDKFEKEVYQGRLFNTRPDPRL